MRRGRPLAALAALAVASALIPVFSPPSAAATLTVAGDPPSPVSSVRLAAPIDRLPIIEDGPTSDDHAALEAWRAATLRDPQGLVDLFDHSLAALRPAGDDRGPVDALDALLRDDPFEATEADGRSTIDAAIRSVAHDPANAARLERVAVAMWAFGNVLALGEPTETAEAYRDAGIVLLERTAAAFPGRRATLLNLAFLQSTTPGWNFGGLEHARAALERDPADLTARALVASIQSRDARTLDGVGAALGILAPLREDPATSTLGTALIGDAHLAAASIHRAAAPAFARQQAGLALAAYEAVLAQADDPGVRAGRAHALELLDGPVAARAALEPAVRIAPGSMALLIELGRLEHVAGSIEGLAGVARTALDRVDAGWDLVLSDARWSPAPSESPIPEDRGFLGWSVGRDAEVMAVTAVPPIEGAGAGAVIIARPIDAVAPGIDHALATVPAAQAAHELALTAAVLEGDVATAERVVEAWQAGSWWSARWDPWLSAARLVADPGRSEPDTDPISRERDLFVAETALRRAGRFAEALELCRAVGDPICAGENAYHAGDPATAIASLEAFERSFTAEDGTVDASFRMVLAAAHEAAGNLEVARLRYAQTAGDDRAGRWRPLAAIRSGDLRLDDDPAAAVAWYDLALAAIEANELLVLEDYHLDGPAMLESRGLAQVAHNNRAVARLRALQPAPDEPPSCDGAAATRCAQAVADAQAAVAGDPANAAFRMTLGWAARLSGDAEGARSALEAAVELDPQLFPAFNDLGVLLAAEGDHEGARRAFTAAAMAAPDYDLARWNLGIAELARGPAGLVAGQAHLADAIRHDRSLAAAPLTWRTDERTYRFGFEAPLAAGEAAPFGRTFGIGAVVLAGAASVAALAQLQSTVGGSVLASASDAAHGWLARQGRRARWRARVRETRRRLPRPLGKAWLPWSFAALVLVVTASWQAVRSAPEIAGSAVLLTLGAVVITLVTHAAGHAVAAARMRGRLVPAAWVPGAAVALLLVPLQAVSGPFPAERLRLAAGGDRAAWLFHVAGPAANGLVAIVAYLVFLAFPVPFLRLLAQVELAALAYALLPVRPLDGWMIARQQPRLHVLLGLGTLSAGTAFALGLL